MNWVHSLFQKLAHDLRTTLGPEYPRVLRRLLKLLPRSLSAEALTALLATFSALFKYVLVPSVDSQLLEQAWATFHEVLPKCHPEVQRAIAEVWGATLRRLKVSLREDCVRILAASSGEGLGDACAWIFVTACKVRCTYTYVRLRSVIDTSYSRSRKPCTQRRPVSSLLSFDFTLPATLPKAPSPLSDAS